MAMQHRVPGRNVSASELEALGKTAARLSDTSGLSLAEACVRTLEHEGLNQEQVRRVVEQANIEAVNQKFASLSGQDRIVHIDEGPADPVVVMDALYAQRGAPDAQLVALEYSTGPGFIKRASGTKVAMAEVPMPNLPGLRSKLASAHDELCDMSTALEFRMEEAFAELRQRAKQASLDGASLCDLTTAWSRLDAPLAQAAARALAADVRWGVKTAGLRVASAHPVMEAFTTFTKVAHEHNRVLLACRNVERQLAEFDRQAGGFLASGVC